MVACGTSTVACGLEVVRLRMVPQAFGGSWGKSGSYCL